MQEKTGAPRYKVNQLNVVYDTTDAFWCAPVVDASETGIFVETSHDLPAGTPVEIMFQVPIRMESEADLPFTMTAEVVRFSDQTLPEHWDRRPGIAFSWRDTTGEEASKLRAFLTAYGVLIRP